MAERKLSLVILGKATSALAALKSTGEGAKDLSKKVTDLLPSFKTIAVAGTAAFGAVAASAYGAVKAAAADQDSKRRLAEQIKRTTGATDEQIASVEKLIDKQEMASAVAGEDLRVALGNLVRTTGDVQFAQEQLNLALDISAATGKDLAGVSEALGKAFQGNIGALTRLGVPLDQNVIKSKDLTEVIKTLNTQFGGAAAAQADTFSGRLKILEMSLGKVVEGIGYALLPFVEKLVEFIQTRIVPVLQAFANALADGKGVRGALIAAGVEAGDFAMKIVDIAETIAKAFATFSNVMITLARPLVFVLGAIASGLVLIFTRSFSTYKETAQQFRNLYDQMGTMKISTDTIGVAFQNFRNDLLGAAAAANLTQGELRKLEQQAAQAASGGANVVKPFIGPLLAGYGATAKAVSENTDLAEQFAETLRKLMAQASSTGGKVKEVADALKVFTDKVISARDATRSVESAKRGLAKAELDLATKTEQVTKAQARFDLVVGGFPKTAKESIEATRRFADAQRSVRDAGLQVADATRSVQEAEKKLAELRAKQADVQKVAGAERSLERSKYGVEEANFRVVDAEKKLAEIRLDPEASAIEIRRAEIDLAEAKLAVFDAVQSVTDAEKKLNEERNKAATADEIAEAERNLERAKYAVTDALDAQTRATEEQSDAQDHLNEITMGATIGSKVYETALKELEDAKRDQEDASYALTDALRREADAMYDLVQAQKELIAAQGKVRPKAGAGIAGGLGVTIGPDGSIVESIGVVSNGFGSGANGDTNVNIKVETSPFTNPVEVGTEIVDALGAYVRSNGLIPLNIGSFVGAL